MPGPCPTVLPLQQAGSSDGLDDTGGLTKDAIRWHGCGPDLPKTVQCGELSVPLDYSRPEGAKITLGFNRLRAQDQAHRVGSLILNPGGPGTEANGMVLLAAIGQDLLQPALHERFDLIGMDPRGTGMSSPIKCDPAVFNRPVSLFPRTKAEFDQVSAWAEALGQSCLRRTGPLLAHVDTVSVARDMEQLRQALGDGKLNFLGLSYGAHLGSAYAELYPKRIRTMALDAIANHSSSLNTIFSDSAAAYEDTFNRFAAWCAQTATCALHGRDVPALFDALVARADQQPIPAPACADGTCRPTVTGGEIRMNAFNWLLVKEGVPAVGLASWDEFAGALLRAEQGDASAFSMPLLQSPESFATAGLAINCLDYPFWHKASDYDIRGQGSSAACSRRNQGRRGLAGDARLHAVARPAQPAARAIRPRRPADPARGRDARPVDVLRVVARDARPHRRLRAAHARRRRTRIVLAQRRTHARSHRQLPHHHADASAQHHLLRLRPKISAR